MGVLTDNQIGEMGFLSVGNNVHISDCASFYNCSKISIGNNVRIDDYCVLSAGDGGINIGNYIHIAVYSSLIGSGQICLHDFCNVSSRVAIYSSSDDFSGVSLTSPMIPDEYKCVQHADVVLGKHAIIGCGSVIMPGVNVAEGAAVGALSYVCDNCEEYGIYAGVPARKIKNRKRGLIELEKKFLSKISK